jgi:hypothetical protein
MLRQIKRIVPLSAGKLAAVIYGAMGIILGFPIALATVLPAIVHARETGNGISTPLVCVIMLGVLIVVPVFYALLGFIIGFIGAAIYNVVAGWLGGLQFEVE